MVEVLQRGEERQPGGGGAAAVGCAHRLNGVLHNGLRRPGQLRPAVHSHPLTQAQPRGYSCVCCAALAREHLRHQPRT